MGTALPGAAADARVFANTGGGTVEYLSKHLGRRNTQGGWWKARKRRGQTAQTAPDRRATPPVAGKRTPTKGGSLRAVHVRRTPWREGIGHISRFTNILVNTSGGNLPANQTAAFIPLRGMSGGTLEMGLHARETQTTAKRTACPDKNKATRQQIDMSDQCLRVRAVHTQNARQTTWEDKRTRVEPCNEACPTFAPSFRGYRG